HRQHYDTAFGNTGLQDWEKANHNHPGGTAEAWEGHCHNSAFAAFYFVTPPPAGKTVNGVLITCEEIKFLGTEFVGHKKVRTNTWILPGPNRSGPFHEKTPSDDPKLFSTEVGKFHKAMRDALLLERMPVIMDLRNSAGGDHSEVWNQAVYRYETHYWETLPQNDWLDIQVRTNLNANED